MSKGVSEEVTTLA